MDSHNSHNSHNSQCSICLDTIGEDQDTYSLSCDHLFHTKCIMDWFRSRSSSGNCPLCNDTPISETIFYGSRSYFDERFKQIKKHTNKNKKDFPELKIEMDKIKAIEKDTRTKLKNKNEYLKENKDIRDNFHKNEKEYWASLRKENKQKMKIVAKYPMLMV